MEDSKSVRQGLLEEQVQIEAQLAEIDVNAEGALAFDEGFADSAQVSAEQGENRALAASLQEQLEDIDRALQRLDDGSYGQCATCGGPIGEARLEAMPAARYCIEHA